MTMLLKEPQLDLLHTMNSLNSQKKKDKKDTLHVLSLFSGCGGMDLGFEGDFPVLKESIGNSEFVKKDLNNGFVQLKKTRFKTVFANDILSGARVAWTNYFSKRGRDPNDFILKSIVDLVKMHKEGVSIFPDEIDIVTGGFPCQDFSIAGKRKGFNSNKNHKGEIISNEVCSVATRGQLYIWMKEVIDITKPKMFIAENVKGLVNLGDVKNIIQNDFSKAGDNGYIVLEPQVLHAADYGVPQSRERVFFIGIKKSALTENSLNALLTTPLTEEYNPYPQPTHSYTYQDSDLKKFVKLKHVFKHLVEPDFSKDLSQKSYSKAKYMGKHCQGQIEVNLEGISPTIRAEHHGNIEFRRLSKKNGGKIYAELNNGLSERRLTVRECALIQTFPPDFEFVIPNQNGRKGSYMLSPSKAYKVIGNAVPPLLAYNLAKRIENIWKLYFGENDDNLC